MADHFCNEHQTVFFKRGNMRGYAHPIGEKNESTGKYPEGWCNEDAEGVAKLEPRNPEPVPLQPGEEPVFKSKDKQIAEHVWWKELGMMLRANDIDVTKPIGKGIRAAYYAQMMSILDIKIENK